MHSRHPSSLCRATPIPKGRDRATDGGMKGDKLQINYGGRTARIDWWNHYPQRIPQRAIGVWSLESGALVAVLDAFAHTKVEVAMQSEAWKHDDIRTRTLLEP